MPNELKTSFTDAWNDSGKAVESILCLGLTLVIVPLQGAADALRLIRGWVSNGAKLPAWILPSHSE